jgi:hypothetical protein
MKKLIVWYKVGMLMLIGSVAKAQSLDLNGYASVAVDKIIHDTRLQVQWTPNSSPLIGALVPMYEYERPDKHTLLSLDTGYMTRFNGIGGIGIQGQVHLDPYVNDWLSKQRGVKRYAAPVFEYGPYVGVYQHLGIVYGFSVSVGWRNKEVKEGPGFTEYPATQTPQ